MFAGCSTLSLQAAPALRGFFLFREMLEIERRWEVIDNQ